MTAIIARPALRTRHIVACATLLTLYLLTACGGGGGGSSGPDGPDGPGPQSYTYSVPDSNGDGWQTASLDDTSIDAGPIIAMFNGILNGDYPGIEAVGIAYRGRLVVNELFRTELEGCDDWIDNRDLARHCMHSTSKSVASALVGLAIEQGYLADTSIPLVDFFPYGPYDNWDDRKRDITVENTLTMRLGLEWDESSAPYGDPQNSLTILLTNSSNHTKALLDLPLVQSPDSGFVYNTGASIALGDLIERAVGMPLEDYAERELFEPLQIEEAEWGVTIMGIPNTGSGLFLTTRSMLKFGQLYLDDGTWNGQQILNPDWIARSLASYSALNWDYTSGYGYQWWLGSFRRGATEYPFYSTRGYGGQFIFVVPSLDLVVAFHGSNYENGLYGLPFELTERYIIPAVN